MKKEYLLKYFLLSVIGIACTSMSMDNNRPPIFESRFNKNRHDNGLSKAANDKLDDTIVNIAGAFWTTQFDAINHKKKLAMEKENAKLRVAEMEKQTKAKTEQYKEVLTHFAKTFFDDETRLKNIGLFLAGTAASIYLFKNGFPIIRKMVENFLFTPALIDETSVGLRIPFFNKKEAPLNQLKDLHFEDQLQDTVNQIVTTYKKSNKNKNYFLNYLFYGEPGTGKTATARAIALESGLDYAIMSGGNVQKLLKSGHAEQRLKEVFQWAQKSKKGLILFIDEADAFLRDPNGAAISEELYSVLNTFLNLTGTESKNISIILSTNHPGKLPKAIRDRVGAGQFVYFGLPKKEQRALIIRNFAKKYFTQTQQHHFTDEIVNELATELDGFSGRNISYLMLNVSQHNIVSDKRINNEKLNKPVEQATQQKQSDAFLGSYA